MLSVQVFCRAPGAVDREAAAERRDPRVVERAVDGRADPATVERRRVLERAPRSSGSGRPATSNVPSLTNAPPPGRSELSTDERGAGADVDVRRAVHAQAGERAPCPRRRARSPRADDDRRHSRATPPAAPRRAPPRRCSCRAPVSVAPDATQSVPPGGQRVDAAACSRRRPGRSRPARPRSTGPSRPTVRSGAAHCEAKSARAADAGATRTRRGDGQDGSEERDPRPHDRSSRHAHPSRPAPRPATYRSDIQDKSDAQRSYSTTTGAWSREPLGVRRGPVDGRADRGVGEVRRRQLVVDAPARVVVERLPAPGPPRVRPGPLAAELAAEVVPAEVVEPAVQVGALARQEARRDLRLPFQFLRSDLAVRDVHVAGDDGVARRPRRCPPAATVTWSRNAYFSSIDGCPDRRRSAGTSTRP